jgi:Lon protease-like protein
MEIPLFPLHQVLCPGIVLPLHIFEDRYQAMTRHCLDTGQPFGVVLIRDGREVGTKGVATVGTTCSPRRPAGSRSIPSMPRRSRTWSRT